MNESVTEALKFFIAVPQQTTLMGQVGEVRPACDACIPYRSASAVLTAQLRVQLPANMTGGQRRMFEELGSLLPTWETQPEFLAPGSGLTQSQLL